MQNSAASFRATISLDWDENNFLTYDPIPIWEGKFPSLKLAHEAIRESISQVTQNLHPHGYIICVFHLGPRGGMYQIDAVRTLDFPDVQTTLEALIK